MQDLTQALTIDQRAAGTITVLDYTLLSGKTITVNANVLTEGVNFTAATSNGATATSIASAINGLALVNAAAVGAVVTIYADSAGTAGNAYNLLTNGAAGALTLSGATLAGGVATTYSNVLDLNDEADGAEVGINISTFTNSSGSASITMQYSYDRVTWFDDQTLLAINSTTTIPVKKSARYTFTGAYIRAAISTSGVVSALVGSLYMRTLAGTGIQHKVDGMTGATVGVDQEHHEIHDGDHYTYSYAVTLASAAVQVYIVTTPNTAKKTHFTFDSNGSAITQVDLYEGADRTGTTLQTVFNSNRTSTNTAGTTVHKDMSAGTTDGTKIFTAKSGSATAQSRTTATAQRQHEFILKPNTKYLLRLTSGTADNLTNTVLSWYEHTDKIN